MPGGKEKYINRSSHYSMEILERMLYKKACFRGGGKYLKIQISIIG
jgi:hypothetical protein